MLKILLTGSSIFEQWGQAEGLAPGCEIINRAVGGTVTANWIQWLPTVIAENPADAIFLYCGSNDLNAEVPDSEIVSNTALCRKIIFDHNPKTKFAYFSIIKAPQKADKWDKIDQINTQIKSQLCSQDLYVETNEVFCPNNTPVKHFYVEDQLHLTSKAYKALSEYTKPLVHNRLLFRR